MVKIVDLIAVIVLASLNAVEMAKRLSLSLIAECVETEAQAEYYRNPNTHE